MQDPEAVRGHLHACMLAQIMSSLSRLVGTRMPLIYIYDSSRRFMSMSTESGQVGFIGLGNMGAAMATNLLKARGTAIVHDVG